MDDPAVTALSELVPGGVRRGELRRGDRVLRWVEAGAGVGASDPVSPLSLDTEIADLGACRHPGLVLVDPTHEEILAEAPLQVRLLMTVRGAAARLLRPLGLIERAIRSSFRPFAERLSGDPRVQGLVLDAYAASYRSRSQVGMLSAESRLSMTSVPAIRRIRAASALPGVPVTVLSATTGLPPRTRDRWTALQAGLAQAAPHGEHIVAAGTGHAIHQERPELVTGAITRVLQHVTQP
jgi:pimeloyl-ACP methyl ester carboxylesterase